jgi:hypothetical protein
MPVAKVDEAEMSCLPTSEAATERILTDSLGSRQAEHWGTGVVAFP